MPETIIEAKNIQLEPATTPGGVEKMKIAFELDPIGKPSSSGKSLVVATTEGFVQVGIYRVSINIIKKN